MNNKKERPSNPLGAMINDFGGDDKKAEDERKYMVILQAKILLEIPRFPFYAKRFQEASQKYLNLIREQDDQEVLLLAIDDIGRELSQGSTIFENTRGVRVLDLRPDGVLPHIGGKAIQASSKNLNHLMAYCELVVSARYRTENESKYLAEAVTALEPLVEHYYWNNSGFSSFFLEFAKTWSPLTIWTKAFVPLSLKILGRKKGTTQKERKVFVDKVLTCFHPYIKEIYRDQKNLDEDVKAGICRYVESGLSGLYHNKRDRLFRAMNSEDFYGVPIILHSMELVQSSQTWTEGAVLLYDFISYDKSDLCDGLRRTVVEQGGILTLWKAIKFSPKSMALPAIALSCSLESEDYVKSKILEPLLLEMQHDCSYLVDAVFSHDTRCSLSDRKNIENFLALVAAGMSSGDDEGHRNKKNMTVLHCLLRRQPLIFFCRYWHEEMISAVRKADPSADLVRDAQNRLPFHVALFQSQDAPSMHLIQALIVGNKSLCAELHRGMYPFQLAVEAGCNESVIYLLLREHPSGTMTFCGEK